MKQSATAVPSPNVTTPPPGDSADGAAHAAADNGTAQSADDGTAQSADDGTARSAGHGLDFGPSGYLPERASKRARKVVLRAPLGLQWVIASLLAGVVLVIAGVLFLQRGAAPPGESWVAIAEVADLPASHVTADGVLVVAAGPRVRAFAEAGEVAYCPASNRLEAPDGGVWSLTGRGHATASLAEHPTLLTGGVLYLDPTRTTLPPAPSDTPVEPACHRAP